MSDQVVLVTGATSFIGSHLINLLLQEGWKVRGTVRSLTSGKTKAVQTCFQQHAERLELVEADLKETKGWDEACKGCTYVLHLACPVEMATFNKDPAGKRLKDPPEVQKAVETVVNGSLCVIAAAKAAGAKRMVMTSSIVAMMPAGWCETVFAYPDVPGAYNPEAYKSRINEEVWSNETLVDGYVRAKTRSEREAWKAVEGTSLEFVTIAPGYTWGPQLHKLLACDSTTPVDIVMNQPPNSPSLLPALPSLSWAAVDVRDVARAHYNAMLKPEAAGNRYLVANKVYNGYDLQEIVKEVFEPMGYGTLQKKMPKCLCCLLSTCDPFMKRMHMNWDLYPSIDNSKALRDLLPKFTDMKESVVDTVLTAVGTGRYERKAGFKALKPELNKEFIELTVL